MPCLRALSTISGASNPLQPTLPPTLRQLTLLEAAVAVAGVRDSSRAGHPHRGTSWTPCSSGTPDAPPINKTSPPSATGLARLGVTPDRIYVDHGLTGTNRERPGLREAPAAPVTPRW